MLWQMSATEQILCLRTRGKPGIMLYDVGGQMAYQDTTVPVTRSFRSLVAGMLGSQILRFLWGWSKRPSGVKTAPLTQHFAAIPTARRRHRCYVGASSVCSSARHSARNTENGGAVSTNDRTSA